MIIDKSKPLIIIDSFSLHRRYNLNLYLKCVGMNLNLILTASNKQLYFGSIKNFQCIFLYGIKINHG